jgi:hypothetical protein
MAAVSGFNWRQSTRCEAGGCVEVAQTPDGVCVRCTTAEERVLVVDVEAWRGFLAAVRAGEFDPDRLAVDGTEPATG